MTNNFGIREMSAYNSDRLIVHLVHGTWPDGLMSAAIRRIKKSSQYPTEEGAKFWFQTDHPFRKKLVRKLASNGFKPNIRAFIWSGANSFHARTRAAERLVPDLVEGIPKNIPQLIIAHSHGGNVAMLALKLISDGKWKSAVSADSQLSGELSIEQMRAGAEKIDLVTLGTPFIRVENFEGDWRLFLIIFISSFSAIYLTALSLIGRLFGPISFLLAIVVIPLLCIFMVAGYSKGKEVVQKWVVDTQSLYFQGRRIQCIRGISDEADMGISMGIIGCNVVRTVLMFFARHLNPDSILAQSLGLVAFIFVGVAVLCPIIGIDVDPALPWWGNRIGLAAVGVIMLMAFASMLQGTLGVELAWAGLSFLTTVESSPDAAPRQIEIVTLTPTDDITKGLRHALYLHPECIPRILAGLS